MPPPMNTPPRAPSVSARLPATLPSRAAKVVTASAHCTSRSTPTSPRSGCARANTPAGSKVLAVSPSSTQIASYRFTRPGPDSARSADTWPKRSRSTARIDASRALAAGSVTWPPSPTITRQPASPSDTRPDTPRPVPGPMTASAAPAAPEPPPTARRSSGPSAGTACASASKSLSTRKRAAPRLARSASIENDHGWLVIRTSSPVTAVAMPKPTSRGAGSFSCAR